MANLLRALLLFMIGIITLTILTALGVVDLSFSHIHLAIPAYIFVIFIQAFVMFYFIGVARLSENVWNILHSPEKLTELFEDIPSDLEPYQKKVKQFVYDSSLCKRQTIPWTMLMLILGGIGFLLGGAHDTGMVSKEVHSGVMYGFVMAMGIGFFKQWKYLGKSHRLLRELKALFQIPDAMM